MINFDNIILNRLDTRYLYLQIFEEIKSKIECGSVKPHEKLPAIRDLAKKLEVNNITIVNAYNLLEKYGYIYKRIGSGSYVQDIKVKSIENIAFDEEISIINDSNYEIEEKENNKSIIDFGSIAPTADLFPVDDFKSVLNKVLDRDKGMAFIYHEGQGYYPLRSSIKKYVSSFGITTDEESIQIISGAQQGIDIISKTLISYGDIVFTEKPTYNGAIAAFKSRAARIVEIPIKSDGIDLFDLENKLRSFRPKFIYVMPNYQNPTGYSYSKYKMSKLIEIADKHDFYIIEDDYLSDLIDIKDKCVLKSLDKADRVIYLKSFSKIFMPGLRLAFMIIPRSIQSEVLSAKHLSDISTSGLIQRAFELYLNKKGWHNHINYVSSIYGKRYNKMVNNIKKYMPREVKIILPKGGHNFWMSLPEGCSTNELYDLCLKNNITIAPGSIFDSSLKDNNCFRLSVASVKEDEIELGIKKLSRIIKWFIKTHEKKYISLDMSNKFY